MSASSAHSNSEFALVTDKSSLAHEIAMALATAFAQHGNAATSFSPLLLSCAAELRDKSGPNGRLVTLPDWNAISEVDPRIKSHPLFPKTVGYHQATSPIAPPATPWPPSPLTPTPTTPAAPTPTTSTPTPAVTMVPSGKLFVLGNGKHRAPMPDDNDDVPESRARKNKVKSAPMVLDEDEDIPARKVIIVKNPMQPTAPKAPDSDAPEMLMPEDDASGSTECLFGIRCKQCIKDDASCIIMLGKKLCEVRKCCRCYDMKKTKCVHLMEEEAATLLVEVTLKRTSKKTRGVKRTRSQVRNTTRNTTRAAQPLHAVDADDVVPDDVMPPEIVPSTHHVDNNVNIDFTMEHPAPDSPAHVVREVAPEPPAPQPSNLDILQTINAMRQDFAGLLQVSCDHVDVIRWEVNTWVDEVEDRLTAQIAAMEKKMREIDLETASNTVNMGHMANAMRIMAQPAGISAVGPVAGPSFQGHPFGDIPQSWLARPSATEGDVLILDPSLSLVGKQFTNIWDISCRPAASGVGQHADAAVETGSNLSSVSSSDSSPGH
ncbi:hypothetical protein CY34DRAFT_17920 [Suillus luteus UH-Slu-Lm8-n1]|uniref:Uncharacterized protein n=1 Tax=Suillus luteus UH-Slu-Lm8-n1 TaxID=930992 RepID=A0A0C9Z9H7_9AGAM|nr:hypothetical protein CY34DRAFT_17920 [Suillus luteus UH-Slu-Lm8-n1]